MVLGSKKLSAEAPPFVPKSLSRDAASLDKHAHACRTSLSSSAKAFVPKKHAWCGLRASSPKKEGTVEVGRGLAYQHAEGLNPLANEFRPECADATQSHCTSRSPCQPKASEFQAPRQLPRRVRVCPMRHAGSHEFPRRGLLPRRAPVNRVIAKSAQPRACDASADSAIARGGIEEGEGTTSTSAMAESEADGHGGREHLGTFPETMGDESDEEGDEEGDTCTDTECLVVTADMDLQGHRTENMEDRGELGDGDKLTPGCVEAADQAAKHVVHEKAFSLHELLRWRAVASASHMSCEKQPSPRLPIAHVRANIFAKNSNSASGSPRSMINRPRRGASKCTEKMSLHVSPDSWVAQQQERLKQRGDFDDGGELSDAEVRRIIKSVLNKLTVERFRTLFQQLTGSGIRTAEHVQVLMREVFEKATTQHHFVGMYAELCAELHKWFVEQQPAGNDGRIFKRVLLNECQSSFEEYLRPQEGLEQLDTERRYEAELLHRKRMLGNLRLVGALLERRMLASRVLVVVTDSLLAEPTPLRLECLGVFLTVVGPSFDRSDWVHHSKLDEVFQQVQRHQRRTDIPPRTSFLLQDLLELRASGWRSQRQASRAPEGPDTLDAVHRRAERETGVRSAPVRRSSGQAEAVAKRVPAHFSESAWERQQAPPVSGSSGDPSAACATASTKILATLRQLGECLDVTRAAEQVGALDLRPDDQVAEFTEILTWAAEATQRSSRQAAFQLAVQLFTSGTWQQETMVVGLTNFFHDLFHNLRLDVPALPQIVEEDLAPQLTLLVQEGLLEPALRDEFVAGVARIP